jgi:hypothetical protein
LHVPQTPHCKCAFQRKGETQQFGRNCLGIAFDIRVVFNDLRNLPGNTSDVLKKLRFC